MAEVAEGLREHAPAVSGPAEKARTLHEEARAGAIRFHDPQVAPALRPEHDIRDRPTVGRESGGTGDDRVVGEALHLYVLLVDPVDAVIFLPPNRRRFEKRHAVEVDPAVG